MVKILSMNNTNLGSSTPGHVISQTSGVGGISGLGTIQSGSQNINTTPVSTLNNFVNVSCNNEEMENQFREIKDCLVASDLKTSAMFSYVNCELDKINNTLKMDYSDNMLPITIEDLNIIYECFVLPYIKCEMYRMGTINQIIDINKVLTGLISATENEKTKLVLIILRDIMCALVNARNDYMGHLATKQQIEQIKKKYTNCLEVVLLLEKKVKKLMGEEITGFQLEGTVSITMWKPPHHLLTQAKFNLVDAWYRFLYNTNKLDVDKYRATVTYVSSFGSRKKAYDELERLINERCKTIEDDYEEIKEENKEEN